MALVNRIFQDTSLKLCDLIDFILIEDLAAPVIQP